jgi:hypothetical protein
MIDEGGCQSGASWFYACSFAPEVATTIGVAEVIAQLELGYDLVQVHPTVYFTIYTR